MAGHERKGRTLVFSLWVRVPLGSAPTKSATVPPRPRLLNRHSKAAGAALRTCSQGSRHSAPRHLEGHGYLADRSTLDPKRFHTSEPRRVESRRPAPLPPFGFHALPRRADALVDGESLHLARPTQDGENDLGGRPVQIESVRDADYLAAVLAKLLHDFERVPNSAPGKP